MPTQPPPTGAGVQDPPDAQQKNSEIRRAYVSRVMNPATYGVQPGSVTTPEALSDAMTRLRSGRVNIIGPECHTDHIPRNHIISLRWAFLDARYPEMQGLPGKMSNGIWYQQKGGGLSLNWPGLNQLASLCSLTWLSFERDDDGKVPLYWRFKGHCKVRYFDGGEKEAWPVGESDLRPDSAECVMVKNGDQLAAMRAKGSQRAASICKGSGIREVLSLRQKYTEDEADMPFVWPALIFSPPADPELDRLLALREMGLIDAVYGSQPRRQVIDVPAKAEPRAIAEGPPVRDFAAEAAQAARNGEMRRLAEAKPEDGADAPPWETAAEAMDEAVARAEALPPDPCFEPGCKTPISDELRAWSDEHLGRTYCHAHASTRWAALQKSVPK